MREFEIDLTKFLVKGLRSYRNNAVINPSLLRCYNLMPSPTGLIPHERVYGIGWETAYFNYLEIKDQNGISWFWYPVFDGHILSGEEPPSEPTTGLDPIPITPDPIPYWINLRDEDQNVWRLYPDSTTGETRAKDSDPAVGTGMSNLIWRGTTTEVWTLKFSNETKTRYAIKV